jgi:DNA-binding PucR family transcriptional regulator
MRVVAASPPTRSTVRDTYEALFEIAALIQAEQTDLEAVFRLIVDHARELIGTDLSWLSLVDDAGHRIELQMASGGHTKAFLEMNIEVGAGIGGIALRDRRPIIVRDQEHYEETSEEIHEALRGEGVVSVLCVPMLHREALIGALYVASRERTEFSETAASLLSAMAGQAAIAIQNARLYKQVVEKNETLERAFSAHRALTDASLTGAGLQEIVTELARLVGRDLWLERVSGSPKLVFANESEDGRSADDVASLAGPELAVMAGERRLGTLHVRSSEPLDALAGKTLEHGATVLALELVKEQAALEVEWRLKGELLEELLQARDGAPPRLRARAEQAEVDLDTPREVAVFQAEDRDRATQLLALVLNSGRQGGGGQVLASIRGERVLVAVESRDGDGEEHLRRMQVKARRAGIASRVGVSAPRSNLALALPQAEAALDLAQSSDYGAFVSYEAMGPLRFVLDAPHTDEMAQLVEEILGPLAEYDAARQGELLQTLRHYLEAGGHHPTTAQRCHIHVSTLKYRLARISEITGSSITEPGARFRFTLAFELRDMLARLGQDPLPAGV